MYRDYENPRELEAMLKEARANYDGSVEAHDDIEELEQRLRLAWADEYEE
jgi:hypothetical protein